MSASSELWQEEEALLLARRTVEDSIEMETIRQSETLASGEPEAIADILRASFRTQFSDRSNVAKLDLFVPEDYMSRSRQFGFLMNDLSGFDFHDELEAITAPTLILYGSVEPAVALGGAALKEHIPTSELVVIEGAGHFPLIEQPDAFFQAVRDFLASVGSRRR